MGSWEGQKRGAVSCTGRVIGCEDKDREGYCRELYGKGLRSTGEGIMESYKGQATVYKDMERYYGNVYDTDMVMMRQEVIWT